MTRTAIDQNSYWGRDQYNGGAHTDQSFAAAVSLFDTNAKREFPNLDPVWMPGTSEVWVDHHTLNAIDLWDRTDVVDRLAELRDEALEQVLLNS